MELQNCINYLLTGAQHEVFSLMKTKLAPYDVTPGQYGVLNILWSNQTQNPKEMAEILNLETSTISGVLDRMQKKDLLDRVIDPENRRQVQVILTEKGKSLEKPVMDIIVEVNDIVLSRFTKKNRELLLEELREIMNANLNG
jgi:DNA-binding MarR family transcriptional regulator